MKKKAPAVRCRIKDVLKGKYVPTTDLTPGYVLLPIGVRAYKVMLHGVVTQIYINESRTYGFLVLEDGTGRIRAKFFSGIKMLENINRGDSVAVIGRIREYNEERYLAVTGIRKLQTPEEEATFRLDMAVKLSRMLDAAKSIAKAIKSAESLDEALKLCGHHPEYLVAGVYELERFVEEKSAAESRSADEKDLKEIILSIIKDNDEGDGVDYVKIIQLAGLPESVVERVINELLEEGSCYEPKPGRIKMV